MMKHKAAKAAIGGLLAIGGAIGFAQSASAVEPQVSGWDCFPGPCQGYYSSSDGGSHVGADAVYGQTDSYITWDEHDLDHVTIHGIVKDTAADGKGAVLWIRVCEQTSGLCYNYRWHWTGGYGTWHYYSSDLLVPDAAGMDNYTTVELRACNGTSGSNPTQNLNCESSWHGPFHWGL